MEWLLIGAAPVLAFANGAKGNTERVPAIYDSGELSYRAALASGFEQLAR